MMPRWTANVQRHFYRLLERIKGSDRAEERDRGVSNLLNDIEALKRGEVEFWRRYGRREGQQ